MTKNKNKDLVVKKERLITFNLNITTIIKVIIICLLLICLWYILYFKHVYIYIHETSKYKYFLFMTMVSILTLLTFMCIGLWFGNLGKYFKVGVIIICLWFAWLGYEYMGIGIDIRTNFGLLRESVFETNSKKGIDFFIENIFLLIILYFISLPFESEK